MFESIYIQNRISKNGKIKRTDFSLMSRGLKFFVGLIFGVFAVSFVLIFFINSGFKFTIDIFFETILAHFILQMLLLFTVIFGYIFFYCFNKAKHIATFKVLEDEGVLNIIFTNGNLLGYEYGIDISNLLDVCVYKDRSFSFYGRKIMCFNEEKGIEYNMKGTIKFIGGDSSSFVEYMQNNLGIAVRYVDKKA